MIKLGGLAACIDTIAIVMAVSTRLHTGINAVIEYTTETETRDVMANTTINGHNRMSYRLSRRVSAIMTTGAIVRDGTVVDVGILKTVRRVTETAIVLGNKMVRMLADGGSAVVTLDTSTGNTRMVKFSIRPEFQKAGGVVAVIAFNGRLHMKFRFTNGHHAVMTAAAITENFEMVNKTDKLKSEGGMTGLTQVTGGGMIPDFSENRGNGAVTRRKPAIVTFGTLGGITGVHTLVTGVISINGHFDRGNGAGTGNTTGANHQLHHVGSRRIGDETGADSGRIL